MSDPRELPTSIAAPGAGLDEAASLASLDGGAGDSQESPQERVSRRWRAQVAPLDKATDDGRTLTDGSWTLDRPVPLWPEGAFADLSRTQLTLAAGLVHSIAVEDGGIVAYGEVWNPATAEGMFSGRLRPEAGWRIPDGAMASEHYGGGFLTTMSGGRLGYVKASAGPSPWSDTDDTWFAEDTTGGTS